MMLHRLLASPRRWQLLLGPPLRELRQVGDGAAGDPLEPSDQLLRVRLGHAPRVLLRGVDYPSRRDRDVGMRTCK